MGPVTAIEKVARRTGVKVFAKSPLPVFPQAALRVLQALDRPESAAGQTDRITATVFRPLLQHALEAAELAHRLAAQAPAIDSEEAFLCGLLHDIGKLPIDRLNLFDSATMRGLLDHGCPPGCAENFLIGCDRGKAGGGLAASWRLPARYVEAIRCHHRPERIDSPLAHLLCLVEWRLGHLEDTPSAHRVGLRLRSTGVTEHTLEAWNNGREPLAMTA
jgi:hypothetical protein